MTRKNTCHKDDIEELRRQNTELEMKSKDSCCEYRVFFYGVRSLIESTALISCSILFIDPSFSSGDEAQLNQVLIIIVSSPRAAE